MQIAIEGTVGCETTVLFGDMDMVFDSGEFDGKENEYGWEPRDSWPFALGDDTCIRWPMR